jgi:flagellar protein FlgJ
MTAPVVDAKFFADFNGLAALKNDARNQEPQALREAARQFESIFAKMVLSSMRSASFGDPLLGSDQQNFYQGMFDDQMSVQLTRGRGLGLADMLVKQLGRTGLAPDADAGAPAATTQTLSQGQTLTQTHAPEQPQALNQTQALTQALAQSGAGADARDAAVNAATALISKLLAATAAAPAVNANSASNVNTATTDAASAQPAPWRPGSPEEFVRDLWPCAEAAGRELGVDPRHLLAQAALETGWGQALPCDAGGRSSFNLFGIKAGGSWSGPSVSVRTLEVEGGIPVAKQARFRAYDSAADSFRDYVSVLRDNPRYADALNTGGDAKAFAQALQRGGYATDPAYARKIAAIAQNLGVAPYALKSGDATPITPPLGLF